MYHNLSKDQVTQSQIGTKVANRFHILLYNVLSFDILSFRRFAFAIFWHFKHLCSKFSVQCFSFDVSFANILRIRYLYYSISHNTIFQIFNSLSKNPFQPFPSPPSYQSPHQHQPTQLPATPAPPELPPNPIPPELRQPSPVSAGRLDRPEFG